MRDHPDSGILERFMRGELAGSDIPEARKIVRHLLSGCPQCLEVTRRYWAFGETPADAGEDGDRLAGWTPPRFLHFPPRSSRRARPRRSSFLASSR